MESYWLMSESSRLIKSMKHEVDFVKLEVEVNLFVYKQMQYFGGKIIFESVKIVSSIHGNKCSNSCSSSSYCHACSSLSTSGRGRGIGVCTSCTSLTCSTAALNCFWRRGCNKFILWCISIIYYKYIVIIPDACRSNTSTWSTCINITASCTSLCTTILIGISCNCNQRRGAISHLIRFWSCIIYAFILKEV